MASSARPGVLHTAAIGSRVDVLSAMLVTAIATARASSPDVSWRAEALTATSPATTTAIELA